MGQPDVIVVGGGLVGAACARFLALRKLSVHILDSGDEPGAASPAAAGMLAPLAETAAENPLLRLHVRGRDMYHALAPDLKEETGIDIGLWTEGILHVALSPDEVGRLTDEIAWQRQMGFNVDWLAQDDIRNRYPSISPEALGAKLAPEDGALEPVPLLKAFLASATRHGASLTRGVRVEALLTEHGRTVGVRAGSETFTAGAVVLAAGAWSGRIGGLPRPLSVEPIRGQMIAVDWPTDEPPAIALAGSGYVLHRNGDALAGTTMEYTGFETSVTPEGMAQVRHAMRSIYPTLEGATVKRSWAGLRPGTPDGQPIVGRDAESEGLWYATGHGRNGVLLAAITGEVIGQLFAGEAVEHDLSPIDPGRYWRT
ncbi:MAG: glycine oxidase ThiO [Gemmatimonadetes bacterium]|nr:glycine oxidase ThiO [Gemmatimonadota bacterium]